MTTPSPVDAAPAAGLPFDDIQREMAIARLRRVAKLCGLEFAIPQDDDTLVCCIGSVLGMIALDIESRAAAKDQELTAALDAAYPIPSSPHASVVQHATDNRIAFRRGFLATSAPHRLDRIEPWTDAQRQKFRQERKARPSCPICCVPEGGRHFPGCSRETAPDDNGSSQCADCNGTRKVAGAPCPVCCPTNDGPTDGDLA